MTGAEVWDHPGSSVTRRDDTAQETTMKVDHDRSPRYLDGRISHPSQHGGTQ